MPSRRRASGLVRFAAAFAVCAGATHAAAELDVGLVKAPGWQLVQAQCGGCHGLDLVRAQRGDRAFWTAAIRRMQATENLWQFDSQTEDQLLTYLSRHYGVPPFSGRRAPLAADLRPSAVERED